MIRQTPIPERPRERCLERGPASLSLRELLAVILGTGPRGQGCMGVASGVAEKSGPGMNPDDQECAFFTAMEVSPRSHLHGVSGLGSAGSARLLAAFELGRRYAIHLQPKLKSESQKVLPHFQKIEALTRIGRAERSAPQEWLGFVPIHRSGKTGGLCVVERGVRTHVNVDPAELFARVLALRPRGIYLFHNHPSGDLSPSPADIDLTHRVRDLCRSLGIRLLGHWIVSAYGEKWIDPCQIHD